MLTECPSCQTRYEVEDKLLRRRGRRIRCSVCEESWYLLPSDSRRAVEVPTVKITAPLASVSVPIVVPPPKSPIVRSRVGPRPTSVRKPRPILTATTLRAGLFVAGVAALMVIIGQREQIVRRIPQFAPAYAALGLQVNLRGLEFRDIKSTILSDNGHRMLAVEGVIAQVGQRGAKVPDVRVAVRDTTGREIYSWTTPAPKNRLDRGETTLFRARLAAPPMAGSDIKVQFAEASSH